jgi:hypothetical protein
MKRAGLLGLLLLGLAPARGDVYVVIYATTSEKTGHAGIAIDRYQILVHDGPAGSGAAAWYDTVRTGTLVYYDLWPADDAIVRDLASRAVEPRYYKLPGGSSERAITVESLCTQGIPHKEGYPCDGLLRIPTSPGEDFALLAYLDRQIDLQRPFDAWTFNCVDFVLLGIERVTGKAIDAGETVFLRKSATPNRLYQVLRGERGIDIIKNADYTTKGSFWQERVLQVFMPTTERIGR